MKNKTIAILLLATTISISGCGGCSQNTDTTEAVNETESIIETEEPTETEEIAVETESTEAPSEVADEMYPGFAKENITFNAGGVVIDYNEKFIAECKKYDTFRECSDDEIKEILKTVIEASMGKIERTPEEYHKTLSELDKNGVNAKDLLQLNEEASSSSSQTSKPSGSNSNANNNTNSNKGNSSSTSNNTGNTAGSQSNTNSSTAGSNSSTPAEQPPAPSNSESQDVINNGDGTITSGDGTFTMGDGSKFGNEGHTDYNNTIQ